jgi:hypothetical protein
MHRTRAFFYVCAGLFLLALSYHLGARNATAQAPGNPIVGVAGGASPDRVFLANGDYYEEYGNPNQWVLAGNIFGGAPTPVQQSTWGSLKSRYRGERGTAQPAPQGR